MPSMSIRLSPPALTVHENTDAEPRALAFC